MIKVSVLYPNSAESHFDMAYYCQTHIPMVQKLLSPALKGVGVEEGIAGGTPGASAPYLAIGHLLFDTLDAFQAAFGPHAQTLVGDIPNYTNTQPVIQISELRMKAIAGRLQRGASRQWTYRWRAM